MPVTALAGEPPDLPLDEPPDPEVSAETVPLTVFETVEPADETVLPAADPVDETALLTADPVDETVLPSGDPLDDTVFPSADVADEMVLPSADVVEETVLPSDLVVEETVLETELAVRDSALPVCPVVVLTVLRTLWPGEPAGCRVELAAWIAFVACLPGSAECVPRCADDAVALLGLEPGAEPACPPRLVDAGPEADALEPPARTGRDEVEETAPARRAAHDACPAAVGERPDPPRSVAVRCDAGATTPGVRRAWPGPASAATIAPPAPASAMTAAAIAAPPSDEAARVVSGIAVATWTDWIAAGCDPVFASARLVPAPDRNSHFPSPNGSRAAILSAIVAGRSSDSSTPARWAWTRHGWQCARWRARRRRSRIPSERAERARPVSITAWTSLAPPAAGELVIFLGELAPSPEQGAFDHLARHARPPPDLVIRAPFELAHDEQLVVALRQAAEGTAQVIESLPALDRRGRSRREREQRPAAIAQFLVRVERDLARPPAAAVLVDAGVLGDLIDPRLERDLLVGGSQTAQGRHEDVLGDVLGAAVVTDTTEDEHADPLRVARVQLLERPIVTRSCGVDELVLAGERGSRGRIEHQCHLTPQGSADRSRPTKVD